MANDSLQSLSEESFANLQYRLYKYMFIVENLGELILESLLLQLHEPDFLSLFQCAGHYWYRSNVNANMEKGIAIYRSSEIIRC